jgi:hypothetical protein
MAKYLLLYGAGRMPESDEEMAQVMKAWDAWFAEVGHDAVADQGNPFTPGNAQRIAPDGSVGAAQVNAGGYSIIEADSIDQATKLANGCPVRQGGADITVFETFEVM